MGSNIYNNLFNAILMPLRALRVRREEDEADDDRHPPRPLVPATAEADNLRQAA